MSTDPITKEAAPLYLQLEGGLTRVDLAHEAFFAVLRYAPFAALGLLLSRLRGQAAFQRALSQAVAAHEIVLAEVPLRADVLERLRAERAGGRRIVLLAAPDRRISAAVEAAGCIDDVIAPGADAVPASSLETFPQRATPLRAWFKALRPHQWVKNVLLFVPLMLSHHITDIDALIRLVQAFFAFSFCASATYILNDLLDLAADRRHPRKRARPFASGDLSATRGIALALVLLVASVVLAYLTSPLVAGLLGIYVVTTLAYSLRLKRAAIVDVMVLAGLYTLRIIVGAAAAQVEPSFWLLAFSMFMFLSLAFIKRYTELDVMPANAAHGRGYVRRDSDVLVTIGSASGFAAILVLALYINSPESMAIYRHPKGLWLLCPLLLYWVCRVWLMATRGHVHDDPVVFALKDRYSLIIGALAVTVVALSA